MKPKTMRFGSVCSGIEAASVAWGAFWEAAWFSEIDPFPCAVLAHRFPHVPNHGDMSTLPERILSGAVEAPDLLCGGTPCQAFSVAGKRLSLSDDRGNLSLVFCRIADAIDSARTFQRRRPSIVFWENVPGVLSTKDNAFGWLSSLDQTFPFRPPQVDGRAQVLLPDPKDKLRGECSTLNISECPNDARESSLSLVLERISPTPKYFLSARACEGILRRAETRGKTLPPLLKAALERSAVPLPLQL